LDRFRKFWEGGFVQERPAFASQPLRDFSFHIAITIAIKILSKKTDQRFSSHNRSAIFPEKTLRDFFQKNGLRSKIPPAGAAAVVGGDEPCVQMWLTFHHRIAIFLQKTVCNFSGKIDQRLFFSHRGDDRV